MPVHQNRSATDYEKNPPGATDLEQLFNRTRNVQGSDKADEMLRQIYKPSGYQMSDPINGIPRNVAQPGVNPDGTVQVSPPLQSAFGPASASAPPPPMQAPGQAHSSPDPGFIGALFDAIRSLVSGNVVNGQHRQAQAIEEQSNAGQPK